MAMQPIGDYLRKLLYQYDCLVVPGLGAFLTHAVSASYIERDGLFLPPRRRLAFNEAMRLDDGILTNYLMFHEQCSREGALAHVDAFVQEIKQSAHLQGSYSIDGVGLFSFNTENSLQFDPELRHNFLGSAYGLSPVQCQSALASLAQSVADPISVVVHNPLLAAVADSSEEEVTIMAMPVRQLSVGWRRVAVAFLAGSLGFISYFTVLHPNQGLQSSLNPASMFRIFTPASLPAWIGGDPVSPQNASVTPVAKSTPAVPVPSPAVGVDESDTPPPAIAPTGTVRNVGAVVAGKAAVSGGIRSIAAVNPIRLVTKEEPVPVVAKTEVLSVAKTHTVAAEPAVVRPFAGSPYAIVVGSFANRGNALRLRKRLIAAGYTDAVILPARKGELIRVAALGAATLDEAAVSKDSVALFTGTQALVIRNR